MCGRIIQKKILTSEDNSDNVLKRNVLPFDKRMKKDVTQKQREMFGRPLAIADAEWYTGSEGEREGGRSIDCPGLGQSMVDWTRLENTLNLSISEYSNSALIVTQVQNLMEILKEFQNIKKSENPIYDRKYFRKGSHWVYLLY